MPQFSLALLGPPRLERDGVQVQIHRRKVIALLAFLAGTSPAMSHSRDTLATLLWPDSDQIRARANLRSTLSTLKKVLAGEGMTVSREQVSLQPSDRFCVDIHQFHSLLAAWKKHDHTETDICTDCLTGLSEAVELYRGDFLTGFTLIDSPDFDDWQSFQSQRLRQELEMALEGLVHGHSAKREYKLAIPFAQRWLQLDPLVEAAHRQMMLLLALSGKQGAALKQFQDCIRVLDEELGIAPSEETKALYEAIKEQRVSSSKVEVQPPAREQTPPPFKGLQYFDVEDVDLFFGREQLTAKLIGKLREQRFLAVVGASGSGKSSLVRAGLVPALMQEEQLADGSQPPVGCSRWPIHIITPTAHPLETLAASLTRNVESVTVTATLIDDFNSDPRSLHLSVRKLLSQAGGDRLLLVVDQFEELFTLCRDKTERRAFVDNLVTAVSDGTAGPTIVLIALRADFYAQCAQYEDLRIALEDQQSYIGQMNVEELRLAIEEPARHNGCYFEPGLVDLLLRDVGATGGRQPEPGALPLLSHALLETWKRRQERTLNFAGYMDSGGVRGAIATTAETVYNQGLKADQQAIARSIFLRLTELGEGTQDTRRRISMEELIPNPEESPAIETVLQTLADARLITMAEGTVEVAHEALIREWPRLRDWLDEDREGLRLHRQLTEGSQGWLELEHDPGALYRGARLAQASEWAEGHADELNPLEREFLEASQALESREAAEREAQRQSELEAAQNLAILEQRRADEQARAAEQLRRGRRTLVGALVVASVLAIVTIFFGFQFRQSAKEAEQQSRLALARELAVRSVEALSADPELSLLLAVEAVNTTRQGDQFTLSEAEVALYRALTSLTSRGVLPGHTELILAASFSPDGTRIVTMTENEAHLWNEDGKRISTFSHEGFIYSASFSPDGKLIVTASSDQTARLWDVDGNLITILEGHTSRVYWASFSPDSKRIVTASQDGTARLGDVEGNLITILKGHTDWVVEARFSLDGTHIVTAGRDNTPILWDADGNPITMLEGHTHWIEWTSFSPDGKRVLTASRDGTARLWDVEGNLISILKGHTDWVNSPSFSPDGKLILTASRDGTARLWDAEGNLITTLGGHTHGIESASFSPDGKRIVTASSDHTARLWDAQGNLITIIKGHTAPVGSASFSPDGKRIVTGSADGTARLWEVEDFLIAELVGHTDGANSATYDPSGKRILTASGDNTAKLWDRDGQLLSTLEGHTGVIWSAVFNPDGTRILTGSDDGTARLWNLEGKSLAVLENNDWAVRQAIFSPDGTRIVTTSDDGNPRLWEGDGTFLAALEGHTGAVRLASFSPDGSRFVTAGFDTSARLWDSDGAFLAALTGHSDQIATAVLSSNGQRIVTAGRDGTAKLWDNEGNLLLSLEGHVEPVNFAKFNPDGTRIVTASSDGTARLWDVSDELGTGGDGNLIATLGGHTDAVLWAGFSPDGMRIATVSQDGTARLWNAEGSFLTTFEGHSGPVISASFAPDGTQIVTASQDGSARGWKVWSVVEAMLAEADRRVTRSLTDAECQRYLHVDECPITPYISGDDY